MTTLDERHEEAVKAQRLVIAATMVVLLVGRSFRNLRELAEREPGAKRR